MRTLSEHDAFSQPLSDATLDAELSAALQSTGSERLQALVDQLPALPRAQKLALLERLRAHGQVARPPLPKIEPQPRGPAPVWDVASFSDERVRTQLAQLLGESPAPKLQALRARLDELAVTQQRQLLARLLEAASSGIRTARLSYAQQRCWFFESMNPGTTTQNITAAVRACGPLDLDLLERSVNEIIRRHESLRTSFAVVDGEPRQLIFASRRISLIEESFAALPLEQREPAAFAAAVAEARQPFDIAGGPLIRLRSLLIAPDDRILVLSMHHLISDQWSMGLLLDELGQLFATNGNADGLAPLPVQYADYAEWEAQALTPAALRHELQYWKSRLAGVPWVLEIPADRPRPEVMSNNGATEALHLDAQVRRGLSRLTRETGATSFMITFAAFNLLLSARTGRDDLLIGTDFASRSRPEVARCIGFFINELALRTNLAGDPDFRTLVARVRQTAIDAYKHQHLPFQWLVEELRPPRDRGRTPLFQVVFDLHNVPLVLEFQAVQFRPLRLPVRPAKFDLTLFLSESPDEATALLEYNTDLFDRSTARELLAAYHAMLATATAEPGLRLSEIVARAGACVDVDAQSWEAAR